MNFWIIILLISFPLAGGLIALYTRFKTENRLKIVLSFGGAYLLSIVSFHLIPHIYEDANFLTGVFLLGGFFFQIFLERYSRGIEHGHLHLHGEKKKLIPYEILFSLSLHSFMEGMPLGTDIFLNNTQKISFAIGIVLHELPAAFAMVSLLKATHMKVNTLRIFVFTYASMSTLGALSSNLISNSINDHIFDYLMAFVVGTFIHIATTILFENSENHRFTWSKIWAILSGIILAALISYAA